MADTEFFRTRMGNTFYEGTMPALVRELKKLNENLEKAGEIALYGSKVPEADREALGLKPAVTERVKFEEKLLELISRAKNSGEASGRMLGEHISGIHADLLSNPSDYHQELSPLIMAELKEVVEWAQQFLQELK